jgi:cysteinyl-tRNA synthetase
MRIRLYNTLTKQVETFQPIDDGHVRMYSCGPTVYDVAHIGNMRAFIMPDILQRVLRVIGGYDVRWVMNVTDIDDKTIRDSAVGSGRWPAEAGLQTGEPLVDLRAFTEYYTKRFIEDLAAVGILQEHLAALPRATAYIDDMLALIRDIHAAGYAYVSDGSVYFNVSAYRKHFPYGRLFAIDAENFREGVRIDADEYDRESVSDFVLWKGQKPGEPSWNFELDGVALPGRPGWHIECSAMSKELLALPFDIHTGGVDLRFPHHEDEIAQCCAGYHGVEQARYWVHNEFLEVEGRKMSKSLGNFYTLREVLAKGYDALDVRYVMFSAQYHSVLNFTFDGLTAASKARGRVQEFIWSLQESTPAASGDPALDVDAARTEILGHLADDMHTPKALAALFTFIGRIRIDALDDAQRTAVLALLRTINDVLAVWTFDARPVQQIPADIREIAEQRWNAKRTRDFATADALRKQLQSLGWDVKDTAAGYELAKVQS